MKPDLSAQEVRALLCYDQDTGVFRNRITRSYCARAGSVTGCDDGRGYLSICIRGVNYRAHRLAWLYCYGEWPRGPVDHANGIRSDNRISNLRLATPQENAFNSKVKRDGLKGASFRKDCGKWRAHIRVNGQGIVLGHFATEQEAHAAYRSAAVKHHGEFARFK